MSGISSSVPDIFLTQRSRFTTEDSRVAFILSLLTGTALSWAEPLIRAHSEIMKDSNKLMMEMSSVFDHNLSAEEAATPLIQISQGSDSVAAFSIRFRLLAGETGWPQQPLITLFRKALSDPVKDALASLDPPTTLDALVTQAIPIDNRIREREREKKEVKTRQGKGNRFFTLSPSQKDKNARLSTNKWLDQEEPKQLGSSNLGRDSQKKNVQIIIKIKLKQTKRSGNEVPLS